MKSVAIRGNRNACLSGRKEAQVGSFGTTSKYRGRITQKAESGKRSFVSTDNALYDSFRPETVGKHAREDIHTRYNEAISHVARSNVHMQKQWSTAGARNNVYNSEPYQHVAHLPDNGGVQPRDRIEHIGSGKFLHKENPEQIRRESNARPAVRPSQKETVLSGLQARITADIGAGKVGDIVNNMLGTKLTTRMRDRAHYGEWKENTAAPKPKQFLPNVELTIRNKPNKYGLATGYDAATGFR